MSELPTCLGQQSRHDIPHFVRVSGFILRSLSPFQMSLFSVVVLVFHLTFHSKYSQLKCMFMMAGIISGPGLQILKKLCYCRPEDRCTFTHTSFFEI